MKIRDVDPSAFRHAFTTPVSSEWSRSTYVHNGSFWESATYTVRRVPFNYDGIHGEAVFATNTKEETGWARMLGSDAVCAGLLARMDNDGFPFKGNALKIHGVKTVFSERDADASDRDRFVDWAENNLVLTAGRLMKRVHGPSNVLGWAHSDRRLGSYCTPILGTPWCRTFGSTDFEPGLHYRIGDPDLAEAIAEATEVFGRYVKSDEDYADYRFAERKIRSSLAANGMLDRVRFSGRIVYDPEALELASEEAWGSMANRSVIGIARSIVSTSSPHLNHPGPTKSALEKLGRLTRSLAGSAAADFLEDIEKALEELPVAGEPARAWFVGKALEMGLGREVRLRPKPVLAGNVGF